MIRVLVLWLTEVMLLPVALALVLVVTAGMAVGAVADVADGGSKEDTGEADDGPQI